MNKNILNKIAPHFIAVLLFTVISFLYFSPVIQGKQILGHDSESWAYVAKETVDYNNSHDDVALWTNALFGGMPTFQIATSQPYNVVQYIDNVLRLFPPSVFMLMIYLLGGYILLLAFKAKPWLAIVGAIAFAFASYNFIIIMAGHNTKAIVIAYMAPLIGGVYMAFRDKKIAGTLVTTLFLSLAIRANHLQILYYTIIILLIFGIVELIYSLKEKQIKSFLQSTGLMLAAVTIAAGINATTLFTTYEYGQYTMRGKSNGLTSDTQSSQHGLSKDYITNWSYGKAETLTLLIPNFRGGASAGTLDVDSETAAKLKSFNVPNVEKVMSDFQLPLYWGDQPGTSGPVYLGAIVIFLFILGFFVVDKRILWWLLPMILLTLFLSWGKNLMWLTDFFIDYVPLYNKFRTVSMMLVATGFGITLLAMLALKEVLTSNQPKNTLIRPVFISAGITAGVALIFALIPSLAGNFVSPADAQFSGDYAFLKETLPMDRASMLRADAWRSVAFILAAALLLWLFLKNILKTNTVIILLAALMLADLVPVAKRYLNDSHFVRKRKMESFVEPSAADNMILADKSNYRVLDASVNIFNDGKPSYFHKNIGGYHAAKLRRYQELISMQLEGEIGQLFGAFGRAKSFEEIAPVLDSLGVLNMLNMKYVIYNKDAAPLVNTSANGNAWFVKNIRIAADANEEMKLVGEIDTKNEIVIDKEFASQIPGTLVPDSTSKITLKSYSPNQLIYTVYATSNQMAVFSEIYYDKGWNAYINGEKAPYIRANYLLRAMPLQKGTYELVFKFEPLSYIYGNYISLIASIVLVIGFIFFMLQKIKQKK